MMHGDTDDNLLADEYVAQQQQDYLGAMYDVAGTNYGDDTALYHHLHDQRYHHHDRNGAVGGTVRQSRPTSAMAALEGSQYRTGRVSGGGVASSSNRLVAMSASGTLRIHGGHDKEEYHHQHHQHQLQHQQHPQQQELHLHHERQSVTVKTAIDPTTPQRSSSRGGGGGRGEGTGPLRGANNGSKASRSASAAGSSIGSGGTGGRGIHGLVGASVLLPATAPRPSTSGGLGNFVRGGSRRRGVGTGASGRPAAAIRGTRATRRVMPLVLSPPSLSRTGVPETVKLSKEQQQQEEEGEEEEEEEEEEAAQQHRRARPGESQQPRQQRRQRMVANSGGRRQAKAGSDEGTRATAKGSTHNRTKKGSKKKISLGDAGSKNLDTVLTRHELSDLLHDLEHHVNSLDLSNSLKNHIYSPTTAASTSAAAEALAPPDSSAEQHHAPPAIGEDSAGRAPPRLEAEAESGRSQKKAPSAGGVVFI